MNGPWIKEKNKLAIYIYILANDSSLIARVHNIYWEVYVHYELLLIVNSGTHTKYPKSIIVLESMYTQKLVGLVWSTSMDT